MSDTEKTIDDLEKSFPTLAAGAFAKAREEAFASGLSVLLSEGGIIYEVFADGRRVERKRIEPPTFIGAGTKVKLR